MRIEQVIVAEPGAVLLYKLSNLLKFYHHTIRYQHSGAGPELCLGYKSLFRSTMPFCIEFVSLCLSPSSAIIGTGVASLLITIEEMHILSKNMFFNSLSLHASRLMDKVGDHS